MIHTVSMNYEIKENENNILNSKTQTNKYETLLIRTFTPTFKDIENPEPKNNQLKDIKEGKRDSAKLDSNLTLQKMNFIQYEEEEKINKKPIKKYNSHKIKKKKYKSKSLVQKNLYLIIMIKIILFIMEIKIIKGKEKKY